MFSFVSGRRGRPAIHVTRDQIDFLMKQGNTVKRMAKSLGCSSSFLYKRLKLLGIPVRRRFSVIDDEELEHHVRWLQCLYPNSGYEVIYGLTLLYFRVLLPQNIKLYFLVRHYYNFRWWEPCCVLMDCWFHGVGCGAWDVGTDKPSSYC